MIRGLTLTQPWATLVAIGAKQWETRSWPTAYRGQVAIHASKRYPGECRDLEAQEPFRTALYTPHYRYPLMYVGKIVALAMITDCVPTSRFREEGFTCRDVDRPKFIEISREEFLFGDYSEGRYAFKLEKVAPLRTPIECRGALGLWTLPDGAIAQIYDELHAEVRS